MGKLGCSQFPYNTLSIHPSVCPNVEFKALSPLHRSNQMIMLSVYIGTHGDSPKCPATLPFSTRED